MNTESQTAAHPFLYFTATLWGWNGSNKRVIAKAEGCWDDEAEADAELAAACEIKLREYESCGIEQFTTDYQRVSVTFICIPMINGRLDHSQTREVSRGELPALDEK